MNIHEKRCVESNLMLKIVFLISVSAFFIIVNSQVASADIISLNPAGSDNIVLSTDKFTEGFFFGGSSNISTEDEEEESPSGGSSGGGGGGGFVDLTVIPSEFNLDIPLNGRVDKIIQVRNFGTRTATFSVSQSNLDERVSFNETFLVIPPGKIVDLLVTFIALDEIGFFTGKIIVDDEEVLVSLNVHDGVLLFDSNVIVLNEELEVFQNDELVTSVTLIPVGDIGGGLDVTLDFAIKDYQNQIVLTKSETVFVDRQTELTRIFDVGLIPVGDYVVGLNLIYPNGVAPSSAHFKVIKNLSAGIFGRAVLFFVIMILVTLILIVSVVIIKRVKLKREQGFEENLS